MGSRNINQEFLKQFPHRITSAIATIHKGEKHKARISLLEEMSSDREKGTGVSQTPNPDPEGYACSDNGHAPAQAKSKSDNANASAPELENDCSGCSCRGGFLRFKALQKY